MDVLHIIVLFVLAHFINSQNVQRRFEYKYSFKGPYLAQKDNQVPFWTYSGNAIASDESVRITPSLRSQKGQIWTKNAINFDWWEVEFVFRVNGRGRIGADGLALWYTQTPGIEGPVFGSADQWNGLAVFFDSFDNDNKRNNPYIMAMVNDGTQVYDHENDGVSQQMGGCLRDFRNKPYPVRAKIEYYKNTLTLKVQQLQFDYKDLDEPRNVTRGLSFAESESDKSIVEFGKVDTTEITSLKIVKRKRSRKTRKKQKKSKKKNLKKRVMLVHNGMTNNDQDYELCLRAENVVLPTNGYFGISAATGGLADDHDVLKFLLTSLRSTEEMAALNANQEEQIKYQEEFQQYQEKAQKAKDEYVQLNPDSAKKTDEEYETSEQRELRQIFVGQSQIYEVIRQLHLKMDEIVGRQERTLSAVSLLQGGGGMVAPIGGQQGGSLPPSGGGVIHRYEVEAIMNNQQEIVQTAKDIKTFVNEIHSKSNQMLGQIGKPVGSAQPVGYDLHVTLNEMKEGINVVKRDVGITAQHMANKGGQNCPEPKCVSSWLFITLIIVQGACLIGYLMYRFNPINVSIFDNLVSVKMNRDSREAQAKKFY